MVWSLQGEVVEEALAERGLELERHLEALIERYADEEENLAAFGARLVAVADSNPQIVDLVVTDVDRNVVKMFSRRTASKIPCLAMMPAHAEHAAGDVAAAPVACSSLPVRTRGEHRGFVLFHAARDWKADGALVTGWVRRTATRLAPVMAGSYILLGVLLVVAARAAHRWRMEAESAARVEALGMIASGINHEIKNPLNTVGLSLQYLGRRHADAETREVVASAEREAKRIEQTLDQFVRFTRVSRLNTETVTLGERLRTQFGNRVAVEGEASAQVDAAKTDDAFAAVVALLSRGEGGRIELSETRRDWKFVARGRVPGMDVSTVHRLFDPYLRTGKQDVGKGLALARAVFQAHGGDLTAQLKGNRLTLRGGALRVPSGGVR